MAERPKGYGMTAELNKKKVAKYDPQLEAKVRKWMMDIVGKPISQGANAFHESLKDGTYLCKLINKLKPGSVPKVNQSKRAFEMMENIGNFLSACEAYGVARTDLFQTVDLYEAQNMPLVINAIYALGRRVNTLRPGKGIGPKESQANVRAFDEKTRIKSEEVIGLQMGTNRGASQAGMTPFGLQRQVEKVNLKGVH